MPDSDPKLELPCNKLSFKNHKGRGKRMRILKISVPLLSLAVLSGCVGFGAGYDIENLRDAEGTGSAFTQALTKEYQEFDAFEADKMMDWPDAEYFAEKGLRAAGGEAVEPELLENWEIPGDHVEELNAARASLVAALDGGGRSDHSELAAKAQARYDCWVEQQEENFQPTHIAACREDFHAAMEVLKLAMTPPPAAPEPAPVVKPTPYVVYFDFDSQSLSSGARATISAAGNEANRIAATEFSVTGHADRAGSKEYNTALSLARAAAVRDGLVALGYAAGNISLAGRGESEPAVATADGVRERANRRVEIIIFP